MTKAVSEVPERARGLASVAARGTIQLLVARGFFLFSGYIISVILARGLGPVEYGVYGVIMSVLVWIELGANAGIPGATAKLISQDEGKAAAVEQAARVLILIVSLILFFLCWVLAPAFARLFNIPTGTTLFRLAVLDIPFMGIYMASQGILDGNRRFGSKSISVVAYCLTKLIGILILLALGLSIAGALVVNVLATVGGLIYLAVKVPPTHSLPSYTLMRSMLLLALPMGLYLASLQVLLSLDLWSLKSLWNGPEEVIGFYVAALNIAKLPVIVPSVLSPVLFASLSWALARSDEVLAQRYIQAAGRFAVVVLFPACVLLALHGEAVMVVLYSSVYATGGIYLRLQLAAFGLFAFLDIFFWALMATGKQLRSAAILVALIPVAALFNVMLIPQFGPIGAASSLVLAICLGTAIAAILAYRRFGSLIRLSTLARVVTATVLMALIDTQIPVAGPWIVVKFVALLCFYALLLILMRELSWEDMKSFAIWRKGPL